MKRLAGWILASPAMFAVVAFLVLPVAATIGVTFSDPSGLTGPYQAFFASGFQRTVLLRTFEVAALTTAISLVVGLLTAYVVAKSPPRVRSILIVLAVFPLLTGVVVRSFAWLVILGRNGIMNQMLIGAGIIETPISLLYSQTAVVIAMVYIFVPLMVLVLVGVLENIPDDLLQASASLGARPLASFMQVVLPLATPGLIVGAVLVFTASFTSYATPHLLGGTRQMMMGTFLHQRAMAAFDWVGASTVAAIMLVVILATVLVMTRLARRMNPMAD